MKVSIRESKKKVALGDLVVSGATGRKFIVSQENGEFTLYDLRRSMVVGNSYDSIDSMMEDFFSSYAHYPKDTLELLVRAGDK